MGPKIAVLAEYDALKGISHACGHHLVPAAALTAAAGVAGVAGVARDFAGRRLRSSAQLPKTAARARRTWPGTTPSTTSARFVGRSAHDTAAPQDSINAIEAAISFFNDASAIRQHLRAEARLHGIITHGGEASNAIPAPAEIECGGRSLDEEYGDELAPRIEQFCRAAARAVGAHVRLRW